MHVLMRHKTECDFFKTTLSLFSQRLELLQICCFFLVGHIHSVSKRFDFACIASPRSPFAPGQVLDSFTRLSLCWVKTPSSIALLLHSQACVYCHCCLFHPSPVWPCHSLFYPRVGSHWVWLRDQIQKLAVSSLDH